MAMTTQIIGYIASGLVFATFRMKEMIPLRVTAICSNIAFTAYGLSLGLAPIWVLHVVLLPLNAWRLAQAVTCERKTGAKEHATSRKRTHVASCTLIAEADVNH